MKIAVIGGGPGGLYFSALAKQLGPHHEVTVWERNAPDDTFGFGVVFSDETLGGIEHADEAVYAAMQREFARWDDIDVHFRGEVFTSGGHGFAAMSRKRLLEILQQRCHDLGVTLHFLTEAPDVEELSRTHDLVLASDGLNSAVRRRYEDTFRPTLDVRKCKYMWLGTSKVFDAFTFHVLDTPHGVMQVHGYPFDDKGSTFILEMHEDVWRAAGFDAFADRDWRAGDSDEKSIEQVKEICADILDGHEVMANNSRWISFTTIRNEQWRHNNVVISATRPTAHFSIGSGTKLAMEDALALAACLHEHDTLDEALTAYELERKPVVQSTQRAAQASLEWFGEPRPVHPPGAGAVRVQHHDAQPPGHPRQPQGARPRVRRGHRRLVRGAGRVAGRARRRCSSRSTSVASSSPTGWWSPHGHVRREGRRHARLPLRPPRQQGARRSRPRHDRDGLRLPAGPDHPGCTGIWDDEQQQAWARIVDFVHRDSASRSVCSWATPAARARRSSCGRASTSPSTTATGRSSPRPRPYQPGVNQVPREMTHADMAEVKAEFVDAARRGDAAGFDLLELHCTATCCPRSSPR